MIEHSILPIPKDPIHFFQSGNLHFGIVKSVDDPALRGRVLAECPAVFDTGPENWTGWCDFFGAPTGCQSFKGDMGIWWPPVPGLLVIVGFEGGNPKKPYCFPAGAWADNGEPFLPLDARVQKKKSIHIRMLKSEAGHTLLFDDNGTQEGMFLCDWTGAGWFSRSPGKKEDEKSSSPCTASRMRKGAMRGGASAFNGSSPKPSEAIKDGVAIIGQLDLNGQGILQVAQDGDGVLFLFACKEKGSIGPSIVIDSKGNQILLSAGETQLVVDGEMGHVYTTSHIVWNQPYRDVVKSIQTVLKAVSDYFKKYLG